jgi:3-deoxy-D-arabino-heptulosonate 7-phosphate (DAHP) synthase
MNVSASVKTDVKTTNGMIRPDTFRVIAGPCTVESYEQFVASAKAVRQAGFDYVRGGAFKPRTSRYSPKSQETLALRSSPRLWTLTT